MSATTDFVAAQNENRRNTMVLLAVLTALAGGIGYLVGALLEGEASDTLPVVSQVGIAGAGLMAAVSIGWSAISLAVGDKMVLSMAGAKEIEKKDAPQLYNVVEEISIAAGVPMPKVMVLETDALNAFATGNKVGSGTIAVTRGARDGAPAQPRHALHGRGRRHGRPDRPGLRHGVAHAELGLDAQQQPQG